MLFLISSFGFLISLLVVSGCTTPPPVEPPPAAVPAPPEYLTLIQRHNANLARLDRVWSRAKIDLTWRDAKGKLKHEDGEGNVIAVLPDRLAVSMGKLGNTALWIGCDPDRHWLFELYEDKAAYVGRHETVGLPCARPLPLPIRPLDLPRLMGLLFISPTAGQPPRVEVRDNLYVIEPPGTAARYWLDPATYQPRRIELIAADGRVILTATLSDFQPVEQHDAAPEKQPRIATRIEVRPADPGSDSDSVTIRLTDLTDGVEGNKIKDRVFVFESLVKALKPETVEVLDADCP